MADKYVLSVDTFETLFKAMTSNQPDDAVFNFSFEEGIQQYKPLMKVIQASYNFTDYYIEARTRLEEDMHQPNIIPYHKGFYRAFSKLHTTTFKYQAQSPQDIIDSLDDHHHLFLFVSEGLLKGYLYLEIDSQQSIAEIKYFSSHVDYRLKVSLSSCLRMHCNMLLITLILEKFILKFVIKIINSSNDLMV